MTEDLTTVALGQAVYASALQPALFMALVAKGVLSREEAVAMADNALLILESCQSDPNCPSVAAMVYARGQLTRLVDELRAL